MSSVDCALLTHTSQLATKADWAISNRTSNSMKVCCYRNESKSYYYFFIFFAKPKTAVTKTLIINSVSNMNYAEN